MDAELVTRPIDPQELDKAVELAAASFQDSPSYVAIVDDAETRRAYLRWLFEANYWLLLGTGCARGVFHGEELVMCYLLHTPDLRPIGAWDMLRAGLLRGLFRFGWGPTARMLQTLDWMEKAREAALGERGGGGVAKFERVTVLPVLQGKGIGTRALLAALRETDARGLAVFLETQVERNVRFYSRLGFAVVSDDTCPVGGGYRSWMMLREPGASALSK